MGWDGDATVCLCLADMHIPPVCCLLPRVLSGLQGVLTESPPDSLVNFMRHSAATVPTGVVGAKTLSAFRGEEFKGSENIVEVHLPENDAAATASVNRAAAYIGKFVKCVRKKKESGTLNPLVPPPENLLEDAYYGWWWRQPAALAFG